MAERIVVDNSVVMSWCFEDEATPYTDAVLDTLRRKKALVPSIWCFEAANVLSVAVRRGRLDAKDAARFAEILRKLPIEIASPVSRSDVPVLLALALETGLTAYDAAYLEAARREHIPLATIDSALRQAASAAGIECFEP